VILRTSRCPSWSGSMAGALVVFVHPGAVGRGSARAGASRPLQPKRLNPPMNRRDLTRSKLWCGQRQDVRPGCVWKTRDLVQSVCRCYNRCQLVEIAAFPFGSCVVAKPTGKPRLGRSLALPHRRQRRRRNSTKWIKIPGMKTPWEQSQPSPTNNN
jgi:hypothetical protein